MADHHRSEQQQQQPEGDAEAARRASLFLAATGGACGSSFDALTLGGLRLVRAQPGRAVCRLAVGQELQNRYGTLHGGAIATLVDVVGTLALITQSSRGGVSLAINCLYLSPMPGGEEVEVDARVVKLGRDVATVEVLLRRGAGGDGQLVAQGTHVKKLVSGSDLSVLFEASVESAGHGGRPRSRL